jgi:hypothetical protein
VGLKSCVTWICGAKIGKPIATPAPEGPDVFVTAGAAFTTGRGRTASIFIWENNTTSFVPS